MRETVILFTDCPYNVVKSSVNIPWAESGTTDADYIHAFQQIVMPIATEFAPELVMSK